MTTHRPFRFGTSAFPAATRADLIALARKIEDLGYDVCFAPDHFQFCMSPSLALLAIAEATQKLRLCSYVFDNDFRYPAVLASEVATLDQLTSGRFELGIGAGYWGPDYTTTGIPFDPPGVRVSRLAETLEIVKRLLTEEKVTFSGEYYTLTELHNFPAPFQKPYPPLMIGAGSKRMLSLAAREANIVSVVMRTGGGTADYADCSAASTAQRIQWIRQAAGERFDTLELNTLVFDMVVTDQRQDAAEEKGRAWGVPTEHMLNSIHYLIGTVDKICEDLQRWRDEFGISYFMVFPEHMEAFSPVVARLAGR